MPPCVSAQKNFYIREQITHRLLIEKKNNNNNDTGFSAEMQFSRVFPSSLVKSWAYNVTDECKMIIIPQYHRGAKQKIAWSQCDWIVF